MERKGKDIVDVFAVDKHSDEYHVGYANGYHDGYDKGRIEGYKRGEKVGYMRALRDKRIVNESIKSRAIKHTWSETEKAQLNNICEAYVTEV